ncbi:MAG TPA: hypothetical protein VMM76_03435 [Pirellulaceae bacterium]|nr:hypothetical protein [Pirellulaceae bacterium]
MSSNHDKPPFEHPLLNSLLEAGTRKTELALEYDRAKSLDDLFVTASNRICLAAFQIMSCFRLPKRGMLVLWVLKRINRSAYDRYWDQSNHLFSACAIFVASRLRDFINRDGSVYADDQFFERMTTWAGVQWCNMIKMSPDEIARFTTDMTKAVIEFEDHSPANDAEHHSRIIDALGRKPLIAEIPEFAKAMTMRDPLRFVEPVHFVRNYERLSHENATKET